jgi:hypothetical protein
MIKKITIVFFCLLSGLYSCKKDSPPDYPSVQISSPYSLAIFNVPGTIYVTGHISEAKTLTAVSVYISNNQNIPVEQTIPVTITSNNMDFSCSYALNDIHMPGGQYYLTVAASNGANIGTAFQKIYIDAALTKRTAIYAITRNSAGVNAFKIDSVFHSSLSYSVPGDYSSSDINSYYQQLYIAGHDSGNVNVYSVPAVASNWSITGIYSPAPYFTNVYCSNDAEFISYYNLACVKCYNHKGALQSIFNAFAGYYPIKTFSWGSLLFIEEKNIASPQEFIGTYYQASAVTYQQANLPGPVVAMFGYDNNNLFIFGNSTTGGGYMLLYSFTNNIFTPVSLTTSAQLLSVAQVNANTYLMSFNNGIMYQYGYNINGMVPYINGINASTVRYDSINNQVIASTGNMINEYNYSFSSASFVASATVPDSVRDVRVLYNK